ncbi:MAG: sigma-70 family RNA polymerase sigma factor [Planctomycetes bacterium]|nr:sigma-70 family RNA polymerase sigma factor [Planctomycetota bacterium]
MQPCTDLVIRARSGDRAALEPLFRAVQDDVYRLLLAELRHEADAEDACQETFRQAVESIGSLRDPGAFPAWLVRIALEKARLLRRRGAAERRAAEELARRSPTTEEETMRDTGIGELGGKVGRAVDGLDPELRTAIRLRYEHGLSYEEIAAATDAPGGTVAWRLSEAHRRLQRVLAASGVALALAALERELEAAPRATAPERLSRAVKRIAEEGPRGGAGGGSGKRPRALAVAAVVVVLGIGAFLAFRALGGASDSARSGAPESGSVARAPAAAPSGTSEAQAADPLPPGPNAGPSLLAGRVFDRDSGTAVPEAEITLIEGDFRYPGAPVGAVVARVLGRADGTFEVAAPAGRWSLNVRASGFVDYLVERYAEGSAAALSADPCPYSAEELEARYGAHVTMAEGRPVRRDIPLVRTATLTGLVVDAAGAPLPDVRVSVAGHSISAPNGVFAVRPRADAKTDPSTRTDSQGRFRFEDLFPAGRIALAASREGYVEAKGEVAMSSGVHDTTLTLRPKPPVVDVAGVVRGPNGLPVAGAVVLAGGGADESGSREMAVFEPGADGAFQARLPESAPWIVAWAPGRGIAVRSLADRGAGPINLEPPSADRTVRGTVLDAGGRPVPGALVQVYQIEMPLGDSTLSLAFSTDTRMSLSSIDPELCSAFMPPAARGPSTRTGADGTFALESVFLAEGGRVGLVADAGGFELGYVAVTGQGFVEIRVEPVGK